MQDLTPVGLSKDGKRLVLVNSSGEEFAVAVDHRLRTALRGDHARLGQLEMKMESALRPRDIQMRIRGGESPETVAAAAQTTVEAIMPFAAPVLAERAHVARLAQGSSVRRRQGEAPTGHRTLGDTAAAYFTGLGIRTDDVDWDAWRRDDGRWTLVANFGAGSAPQQAQFSFDQRGRYVVADNDEARMLTGELTRPEKAPARPAGGRRLSAVPADDELPLGDDELGADALELVREPDAPEPEPEPDASESVEPAPAEEQTTDLSEAAAVVRDEPLDEAAEPSDDRPAEQPEKAPTTDEDEAEEPRSRKSRRKGRSSVPSWDEIMFGGGKQD
jgi:hypothetical protein